MPGKSWSSSVIDRLNPYDGGLTMAIVRTTESKTNKVLNMQQEKNLPKVLHPPP